MLIRFVIYNCYAKDTFLSRLVTLYMVRLSYIAVSVSVFSDFFIISI